SVRWCYFLWAAGAAALLALGAWWGWAEYHLRAACRLADRRAFDQALDHLGRCLQARPHYGDALFLKARTARRAGLYEEAEEALSGCKDVQYDPDALDLERALLHAQQGNLEKWVQGYLWSRVNSGHPDTDLILEALAQGYLKSYQLASAVQCLDQWLERRPDAAQALVWRAEAHVRLHNASAAIKDYTQALELEPQRDDVRLRLAELCLQQNRPRSALDHFRRLSEGQSDDPATLLGLARCHRQLGQTDEARRLLDRLLSEHPGHAAALGERGQLERSVHGAAEAEKWLRQAVTAAPYERELVYNYLLCLEELGKRDEAGRWRERLQQIEDDVRRLAEVVQQITRAPNDPGPRCEAGVLLLRNGQNEEGLRWLASALQRDAGHRPTHRVLADYYERKGDPALAARHRQAAEQGLGEELRVEYP
ncbi:MAG TPA: tetratricopeptide repeat protein, partial [Gemmataceae bacterium]|nr:tetratricopeptide repeat protein [Gemmataceae bacterium]